MKITYWRRISQVISLIVIIYGGAIFSNIFDVPGPEYARGTEGEKSLTQVSLPVRTCRYVEPKPTLFQDCGLKSLLQIPLNRPPWTIISVYLLIILLFYFVFGRFMCGWFCPLGFLSDILNIIRKNIGLARVNLPEWLQTFISYWRYAFLLFLLFASVAIIIPFAYGIYLNKDFYLAVCQVCPSRTMIPLLGGKLPTMPSFLNATTTIFSILSLVFLGVWICGLAVSRAWCRICPNGAFTGLFNKGALLVKEKDLQKCTKCGICMRVCPMDNDHVYKEKDNRIVNHTNCIMCLKCTEKCPEDDCLRFKAFGKTIFRSCFNEKEDKDQALV